VLPLFPAPVITVATITSHSSYCSHSSHFSHCSDCSECSHCRYCEANVFTAITVAITVTGFLVNKILLQFLPDVLYDVLLGEAAQAVEAEAVDEADPRTFQNLGKIVILGSAQQYSVEQHPV
jgi:hypothetical protein